ncbi:MAG: hypothetical protein PUB63_01515 [Clostridia bacterium]|nr:hypothetical protein [Clostridia bacterium]
MSRKFKHDGGAKASRRQSLVLVASILLILAISVGGTLAYLATQTGPVANTFTPTSVGTEIEEKNEGNVKKNVTVTNTGSTDAYVRAAIVVTWINDAGEVYPQAPVLGTNYTMDLNKADDAWKEYGGYYYWYAPVPGGEKTGVLIDSAEPIGDAPEGYYLSIEILAQAIQATPKAAVIDAWGSDVASAVYGIN